MQRVAWQAEQLGFDSIWVYDHFHTVPVPTQEPTFEAWTLMAALGAVTERVRLGQMCTCNGYRSPSYLAKVAASIDVITNGRVEMGIGGGWYEHEYLAYGYPFPKPSVRLGELDEAVQIMRRMWTEESASFAGDHYTIDGAICQPKPIQSSIPLWIAGGGEQVTLRTAARYADYTNFGQTLENFRHKSSVLERHCEAIGRDYASITRSANFNVVVADDEASVHRKLDQLRDRLSSIPPVDGHRTVTSWFGGPEAAVGTPQQLIDLFMGFADAGLEYVIAYLPDAAYDPESLELFAAEVMPAFG